MTDLLGKYPDLMEEFNDFLERCENIGNCQKCQHFKLLSRGSISFRLYLIEFILADGFLAGVMSRSMCISSSLVSFSYDNLSSQLLYYLHSGRLIDLLTGIILSCHVISQEFLFTSAI